MNAKKSYRVKELAEKMYAELLEAGVEVLADAYALVADRLPPEVTPQLAPISSVMGQILMYGMWSENEETPPMEVRTLADWVVRQRLLAIPGVSQVFTMGGGRMQFQVLVDPDEMLLGIAFDQVQHRPVNAVRPLRLPPCPSRGLPFQRPPPSSLSRTHVKVITDLQ